MGTPAYGNAPSGVRVQLNPAIAERSSNPLGTDRMVRDWELLNKQLSEGSIPGPLSQAEIDKRQGLQSKFTDIDRFEAAFQRWNNSSYLNVKVPGDGNMNTTQRPSQQQIRKFSTFLRGQAKRIADALNAGDKKLAAQERRVMGRGVENFFMRNSMPSNGSIFMRAHRDLQRSRNAANQTATSLGKALKNGNWKSVLSIKESNAPNAPYRVARIQKAIRSALAKKGPARTKAMAQVRRMAQSAQRSLKGNVKAMDTRLSYIKRRADHAGTPLQLSKGGEVRGLRAKGATVRNIASQFTRAFGATINQQAMKRTLGGRNSPLSAKNIQARVKGENYRPADFGVRKDYTVRGQKG